MNDNPISQQDFDDIVPGLLSSMTMGNELESDAEGESRQQHLNVGPAGERSEIYSQLKGRLRRKSSGAASEATKAGLSKVTKRHSRTRSGAFNPLNSLRRNQDSSLAAPPNDVDNEQSDTAASAPKSSRKKALDREVADMEFRSPGFLL